MILCMSVHVLSQMCSAWSGSWHLEMGKLRNLHLINYDKWLNRGSYESGKEAVECISGDWPIYGIDLVSWERSAGHTE